MSPRILRSPKCPGTPVGSVWCLLASVCLLALGSVLVGCGEAAAGGGPPDGASWSVEPQGGRFVRVATVQFDARPEEPEVNRDAMERLAREADRRGAKLVLFHENSLLDYGSRVEELAEQLPGGPTCERFAELSVELGIWIGIGLAERDGDALYIAQAYFGPRGYIGRYRKTWLFHNRADKRRDEWAQFDPGDGPERLFRLAGMDAATLICADADSDRCIKRIRELEPDLVLFPNNRSNFHTPDTFAHLAKRMRAPVLAANRSGTSWQFECNGGSFLLGRDGRTLARANRVGREEVLICDVPLPRRN